MTSLIKKDQKKGPNQFLDFDQLVHKKYNLKGYFIDINMIKKKQMNNLLNRNNIFMIQKKRIINIIFSYDQQKLEIEPLFQKVELLQIERKQLMDEIDQYKLSQMEILKKYESEYQEKDKLNKECAKLKQQIQAQIKIQAPKEFQEKKSLELKDSMLITIKDIIHDFMHNYNHIMGCKDENGITGNILDELLQQINNSIINFIDNLLVQSTQQSEEIIYLKDQIEKTNQTISNLQDENQDLSTALETEKYSQHTKIFIFSIYLRIFIIKQKNFKV